MLALICTDVLTNRSGWPDVGRAPGKVDWFGGKWLWIPATRPSRPRKAHRGLAIPAAGGRRGLGEAFLKEFDVVIRVQTLRKRGPLRLELLA